MGNVRDTLVYSLSVLWLGGVLCSIVLVVFVCGLPCIAEITCLSQTALVITGLFFIAASACPSYTFFRFHLLVPPSLVKWVLILNLYLMAKSRHVLAHS